MKNPFFKNDVDAYLSGEIMFCSLPAQGVFSIICNMYWKNDKKLCIAKLCNRIAVVHPPHSEKMQMLKTLLDELKGAGVINIIEDHIQVKFLDELYLEMQQRSHTNSKNAHKRWGNGDEQPDE